MEARSTLDVAARQRYEPRSYRVEYWERPGPDMAWNLDAWELDGCSSAREALEWAEDHASGRRTTVYAVVDPDANGERADVLLAGTDPNRGDPQTFAWLVRTDG